ncbi:hypothetical protein U8C32_13300 [Sinorhizobium medicae]|uniref:hypothetical protein n=1 Tax=Sinorhizobium medicae TaxID=110321 RepID=UPI000360AFB4|nr:hypothetical protein [Sinorhizobium medicae]MDX0312744.1 hypothetical protein [Sinorhizobium meliloti]WQO64301.1 hypothetical protein U8C40_14195 [Sinorhizobium medicae]WQO71394.1 hypothetical protein U8C31_13935 [Sinorhizobium medicae]WQO90813.1 hypothetical protein U8C32_13300 [Sinorhizobium medicae]
MSTLFDGRVKLRRKHLIAAGIADSAFSLDEMIREGIIRKPHKDGPHMQSRVWWWSDEIREDLARMRTEAAE